MADYKELIRKAIQALPENNGAARRAVYEKARAALVGQLRGLNPPLAARDITQHRLQLEDCIRQVEQEASEAVIAGLKQNEELPPPPRQPALPPPRANGPVLRQPSAANGARPPAAAPAAAATPPTRQPTAPPRQATPAAPRPTPTAPSRVAASAPRQVTGTKPAATPAPPRLAAVQSKPAVAAVASGRPATALRAAPRPQARTAVQPDPEPEPELEPETIEDIIAAAEEASAEPYQEIEDTPAPEPEEEIPAAPMFKIEPRSSRRSAPTAAAATPAAPAIVPRAEPRPVPSIVARAEATKSNRPNGKAETPRRGGNNNNGETHRDSGPPPRPQLAPRPHNVEPMPNYGRNGNAAMSAVREVEVERTPDGDPQIAIERAIATLEREARNDGEEASNGVEAELPVSRGNSAPGRRRGSAVDKAFQEEPPSPPAEPAFARAPVEPERGGGGSAITIFLLVFLVLLVAAGGGGFWAWREGYIDFDAMFGKSQPQAVAQQAVTPLPAPAAARPSASTKPVKSVPVTPKAAAAPQTNTEAASDTPAQSAQQMTAAPADQPAAPPAAVALAEPSAQTGDQPKSEERLTQSSDAAAAGAADSTQPANPAAPAATAPAGSQSLLLEASQDGTTGAVPFSGTVEWSKGTDEMGQPTLVGKASIPARNLGVTVLIRKNADPTLPASHLMEINFSVNDSFIGGAISGLPGVLLKNEELVQGTPLVGASARVVGNSFLFALSSSPADETTNKDLLTSRKWMDLAIIYATGKKAIITLEKDDKAEAMFNDVFAAWAKQAATTPAATTPAK